jgi:uridylate kinase
MSKYKRILLKLSGEALMADMPAGIDTNRLMEYAQQIKSASETGVKIGIVIGGGNIFRGLKGVDKGFDRIKGDYMGMLATVINGLAISSALESLGIKSRVLTAISMEPVGERYSKTKLEEAFEKNEIVIFTFGTGNPFFTTDTASALRAVEMNADVLLKGTRVDGVYTADPEKDPKAVKFEDITFTEAYNRGLNVMDLTSITMCRENNLPIIVFDMNKNGNLQKLVNGEKIGTLVHN